MKFSSVILVMGFAVFSIGTAVAADQPESNQAGAAPPASPTGFGSGTGIGGPGSGAGSSNSIGGGFGAPTSGAGGQTFGAGFNQQTPGSGPFATNPALNPTLSPVPSPAPSPAIGAGGAGRAL